MRNYIFFLALSGFAFAEFCAYKAPAKAQYYIQKNRKSTPERAKPYVAPQPPERSPQGSAAPRNFTLYDENVPCTAEDRRAMDAVNKGLDALSSNETADTPTGRKMLDFLNQPGNVAKILALQARCRNK